MWLYREKILEVVTGLPSSPEARRFALMVLRRDGAGAGGGRACCRSS